MSQLKQLFHMMIFFAVFFGSLLLIELGSQFLHDYLGIQSSFGPVSNEGDKALEWGVVLLFSIYFYITYLASRKFKKSLFVTTGRAGLAVSHFALNLVSSKIYRIRLLNFLTRIFSKISIFIVFAASFVCLIYVGFNNLDPKTQEALLKPAIAALLLLGSFATMLGHSHLRL